MLEADVGGMVQEAESGSVCGVMDTVAGNGDGNTSSDPEQECLHFI